MWASFFALLQPTRFPCSSPFSYTHPKDSCHVCASAVSSYTSCWVCLALL